MDTNHHPSWNGLVEQRQMLVRVLQRRCNDWSIVEDLAQETLLRAARYRPVGIDPSRLPGWLQRIARNVLNDHRRRHHRGPRPEPGSEEALESVEGRERPPGDDPYAADRYQSGQASLCREEAMQHVLTGLRRLDDPDRQLIAGAYREASRREYSLVSPRTQQSAKYKGRLFRARRRLQRAVERSAIEARHIELLRVGGRS